MAKQAPKFPIANSHIGARIKQLRLNLLVHSCMYYELDTSIIPDATFDGWCKQLVSLQGEYPSAYSDRFDPFFETWDGITGFHLPHRDPWVYAKAQYLIKLHEAYNEPTTNDSEPPVLHRPPDSG